MTAEREAAPEAGAPRYLPWGSWEAFALSPDGVVVTDPAGMVVYANPRIEEMSGYAADELVGHPVERLVPTALRPGHDSTHRGFRSEPRPRMMGVAGRLKLQRRDGTLLDVEIALAPVLHGARVHTVATVRDVSSRVVLEAERSRLLDVLDLVPDMVVVFDSDSLAIEYANDALAVTSGRPKEGLLGRHIGEIALLRDGESEAELDAREAVAQPGPGVRQLRLRTAAGELFDVEAHGRIVADGGLRKVIAVIRDLRERVRQEERLRASEEAFRTAFLQAPNAVALVTPTADGVGEILLANAAYEELFGGPTIAPFRPDLLHFRPARGAEFYAALAADLFAGRRMRWEGQAEIRRPDGEVRWAEVRVIRFALPASPEPVLLAHLLDVTDHVLRERRQRRDAGLSEVVAQVSTAVLAGESPPELMDRIARSAADLVEADTAAIFLRNGDGSFRAHAVRGLPLSLLGTAGAIPDGPTLARLRAEGTLVLAGPPEGTAERWADGTGPVALAWFGGATEAPVGFLGVARATDGAPFTAQDADDLARIAAQTELAIPLALARADQQRLAVLQERQRIARDLHDGVVQDAIALGMRLASESEARTDGAARTQSLRAVESLEQIVRDLRRVVFALRVPTTGHWVESLEVTCAEAARVLGHRPEVTVDGPVDRVAEGLGADLVAVLREALSNIARHAKASHTSVRVFVDEGVRLVVEDDGRGIPEGAHDGWGTTNIRHRALVWHGQATWEQVAGGGTRLVWSCPSSALQAG
jgi:PAS domain S-box-containing protein